MKYIIGLFFSIFFLALSVYGCGEKKQAKSEDLSSQNAQPSISENPAYQKGLAIVAKNDCFTCHQIEEKSIGPSYKEVARKYSAQDIDYLTKKISVGGKGVWGEAAMPPHPQIAKSDIVSIVDYILLLK